MFPGMVVGIGFLGNTITAVILGCDEIPNEKYQRWSILIEISTYCSKEYSGLFDSLSLYPEPFSQL